VGSGGPKAWWAPACGYSGSGRNPLRHSVTSGIRAEGRKTWENVSRSHGDGGARKRLRWVTQMVVMEELGPMCDGGDCWV
jgi:hypothetical protein